MGLILFFIFLLFFFPVHSAYASVTADTFRVTLDGAQQKDAIIYGDLIAYTNFGGAQGSDIWAYDLMTGLNYPVVERVGEQYLTGHFGKYLVYEDYDGADYNVRLFNKNNGQDILVAGGSSPQTSGVTNGRVVAYIDGGACGSLNLFDIHHETTTQIISFTCAPVRISQNTIVFHAANPKGTDIMGYDIKKGESFDIAIDDNFQESPNIFNNKVVWVHYITGALGDYNAIKIKDLRTDEVSTIYESTTSTLQAPAVSNRYVIWSESTAQHVNGIKAADFKTGEVFEVQPQGPHQNSHTMPSIWRDTAAWMSFRTGNGDIYVSEFTK